MVSLMCSIFIIYFPSLYINKFKIKNKKYDTNLYPKNLTQMSKCCPECNSYLGQYDYEKMETDICRGYKNILRKEICKTETVHAHFNCIFCNYYWIESRHSIKTKKEIVSQIRKLCEKEQNMTLEEFETILNEIKTKEVLES